MLDPKEPQGAPKLLLVEGDEKAQRTLSRVLRSVGPPLETWSKLERIPARGEYALVIVDCDPLAEKERSTLLEELGGGNRLLFVSSAKDKDALRSLFSRGQLTNLIARLDGGEIDHGDLLVTVRKILQRDIFGLEKYFPWGVQPTQLSLTRSRQKNEALRQVQDFATAVGFNTRFANQVAMVADEFITNALYNAPVDDQGNHRYAAFSRTQEVNLEPAEAVELKYCSDGDRFGLSISDPFGSLLPELVLQYLSRCLQTDHVTVEAKEGGAGLGLFYVFDGLSHLVVNLAPGRRTELVGLIDAGGTFREFLSKPKSFNIFCCTQ